MNATKTRDRRPIVTKYRGIKGGGKFKVVMKSETEIECNWSGDYKLGKSK